MIGLAAVASVASAQKPEAGDIGVSLNLTGLINNIALSAPSDVNGNSTLMLRYYLSENMAVRIGFGITSMGTKTESADSNKFGPQSLTNSESSLKRMDIHFSPGIEKHFEGTEKLDPYAGVGLTIGLVGKTKFDSSYTTTASAGTATGTYNMEAAGGTSIGFNLILGFNYFFSEKIAIGAETSWGFNSTSSGGEWTSTSVNTPVGGTTTTVNDKGTAKTKMGGLGVMSTAGITLSYFFH
jgi:hypothetical protein